MWTDWEETPEQVSDWLEDMGFPSNQVAGFSVARERDYFRIQLTTGKIVQFSGWDYINGMQ